MKKLVANKVYKSISNNKVLIDNSIDIESKWNRHKTELKFGNDRNTTFQKDWNDYREYNFVFEVLPELKKNDEEKINYNKELKILENMVIEELNIESRY